MKAKPFTQTITQESEIFLFGKYKHCTVQHVLRTDPSYILWLYENKIVKFPEKITELAQDKTDDLFYGVLDNDDDLRGLND